MTRIYITILVCISCFTANNKIIAQSKDNLDSLINEIELHKEEDSAKVYLLIKLAKYHVSGDLRENLHYINEAISLAKKIQFHRGIGVGLNALSQHYIVKGDLDQGLIQALNAKDVLSAIGDEENLLVTNSNLARIYNVTGKYEKSLELHLQNLEIVKNTAPSSDKAGFYFYVAKTYEQLLDLKNAEHYYLAAKNISKEAGFSTGVAIAQGSLGNLYNTMGEFEKAITYLNETLEFALLNNQISNIAAAYFSLAKSYEGLGDYNLAIGYNEKSIDTYVKLGNYRLLKSAYLNQSLFYEKMGQYEPSNKYLKLHYVMVDSLFSQNKVKVIEELQTKYETEKKELEIASLSQLASIKDLEIKQKNQGIIIGVAGVILVALIIYLFYRHRYLKNQQTQIELEQRFLRSQLNPHFISNALLAVQNFMLKNQAEKAAIYLTKFSKLMREILENSRHEFIPVQDEIHMITNFLDIHKLRMNESFDYKIEIDDNIDTEGDTIPPMFIQPFIENAIEHGIINAKEQGMIALTLVKQDEYIAIEIRDNGGGIISNDSKSDHRSLSTTIIKERMALFNKSLKNKIQLIWNEIRNEEGEIQGTKVELKVPFSYL